jgi:hypothetical protein
MDLSKNLYGTLRLPDKYGGACIRRGIRKDMSFDRADWWGHSWKADTPWARTLLGMLLPQLTQDRRVDWKGGNKGYYRHRGLSSIFETQLYIWSNFETLPRFSNSEDLVPNQFVHQGYCNWWSSKRRATLELLRVRGDCQGDYALRQKLSTQLQELVSTRQRA